MKTVLAAFLIVIVLAAIVPWIATLYGQYIWNVTCIVKGYK